MKKISTSKVEMTINLVQDNKFSPYFFVVNKYQNMVLKILTFMIVILHNASSNVKFALSFESYAIDQSI